MNDDIRRIDVSVSNGENESATVAPTEEQIEEAMTEVEA